MKLKNHDIHGDKLCSDKPVLRSDFSWCNQKNSDHSIGDCKILFTVDKHPCERVSFFFVKIFVDKE